MRSGGQSQTGVEKIHILVPMLDGKSAQARYSAAFITASHHPPQLITRLVRHPVVIIPIRQIRNRVVGKTGEVVVAQRITVRLAGDEVTQITHAVDAPTRGITAQPSSDGVQWEDAVIQPHADELVARVRRVVSVLRRRVLRRGALHGGWVGDETASHGGQVGENEVTVRIRGELGQRGRVFEVVHGHGGEHGDDDIIVGKVGIERLTQGEVGGVVVEGGVDGGVGGRDIDVFQASEEFL